MTVTVQIVDNKLKISKVEYTRTNHVISVKTIGRRNLEDTFHKLKFGNYCPKTFSALTLTHKNPNVTVICFSTGNLTLMGTTTFYGALYVLNSLKRKLNIKILSIKLTNIVYKFNLKNFNESYYSILDIYKQNKDKAACDLENFPSCTYSLGDSNVKANLFDSGKVVCAGTNSDDEIVDVTREIVSVVERYRNGDKFTNLIIKKK